MVIALFALIPQAYNILFVGNSLLNFNDVPATVTKMLQSDDSRSQVSYKAYFVGHLEDIPPGDEIETQAASGKYAYVVLQAAMVSSSGTVTYDQSRGIALAKLAKAHGARVILYVEWPRRGIDETEYTMNVYRGIAQQSGAEILPVCYAFNNVLARAPQVDLYEPDGNHASQAGSYVAACCVFTRIGGLTMTPSYQPEWIDPSFASIALDEARKVDSVRTSRQGTRSVGGGGGGQ